MEPPRFDSDGAAASLALGAGADWPSPAPAAAASPSSKAGELAGTKKRKATHSGKGKPARKKARAAHAETAAGRFSAAENALFDQLLAQQPKLVGHWKQFEQTWETRRAAGAAVSARSARQLQDRFNTQKRVLASRAKKAAGSGRGARAKAARNGPGDGSAKEGAASAAADS
jgi:hypothetical protein